MTVPAMFSVRDPERNYAETGIGFRFPSGQIAVEWNRRAWPPEQRLEHEHVSLYGSVDDLKKACGVRIRPVATRAHPEYVVE